MSSFFSISSLLLIVQQLITCVYLKGGMYVKDGEKRKEHGKSHKSVYMGQLYKMKEGQLKTQIRWRLKEHML